MHGIIDYKMASAIKIIYILRTDLFHDREKKFKKNHFHIILWIIKNRDVRMALILLQQIYQLIVFPLTV